MAANVESEQQRLIHLGKQGKLFTIEVSYTHEKDVHVHRKRNVEQEAVLKFRKALFSEGLTIPKGPSHWSVVSPLDINTVDIFRQDAYFY